MATAAARIGSSSANAPTATASATRPPTTSSGDGRRDEGRGSVTGPVSDAGTQRWRSVPAAGGAGRAPSGGDPCAPLRRCLRSGCGSSSSRHPSAGRRVVRVRRLTGPVPAREAKPVTAPSPDRSLTASVLAPLAPDALPSAPLALEVTGTTALPRLVLAGEVDCTSAPRVGAALDEVLAAAPQDVVVDLTAVTFLDSAGLCTLASAHRKALAAGGRLRVLAATRAVVRPLQITGLWDLFGGEQVGGAAS
ncbi:STAS domain-containing protein [Blastococcus sp. KM273129]|nr:STAS domain-containing protein [Blastococcus sp. KM273129]